MDKIDDEFETPPELYKKLCFKYKIRPEVDICATDSTSKCGGYIDKEMDSFKHHHNQWEDIWCNPPHSNTRDWVILCHKIWKEQNVNILMIIPANSICTKYFEPVYPYVEIP